MDKWIACGDCIYLDKTVKRQCGEMYRYGCKHSPRDMIVGYIGKESDLKYLGCSYCNKLSIGTKIKVKSRFTDYEKFFLYCGKYMGKPLLYGIEERKIRIQSFDSLRTKTGKLKTNIEVIRQEKEEFEKSVRMAKRIKRKYIDEEQEALPFN